MFEKCTRMERRRRRKKKWSSLFYCWGKNLWRCFHNFFFLLQSNNTLEYNTAQQTRSAFDTERNLCRCVHYCLFGVDKKKATNCTYTSCRRYSQIRFFFLLLLLDTTVDWYVCAWRKHNGEKSDRMTLLWIPLFSLHSFVFYKRMWRWRECR